MTVSLRTALKFTLLGIATGLLWGGLEASGLFLFEYAALLKTNPGSILSLYITALLNYVVLGLIFGLVASLSFLLWAMLNKRLRSEVYVTSFFFSAVLVIFVVLWAGVYINRYPLARIPLSHPTSVLVSAALLLSGFIAIFLLYRFLFAGSAFFTILENFLAQGRRMLLLLPAALLTLAAIFFGLTKEADVGAPEPSETTASARNGAPDVSASRLPDILLITVETLRADFLDIYGSDRGLKTPNIDNLSAGGATFLNFYSQSSWTRATVTSIMTSLHPQQHGATGLSVVVMDSIETLPKILRDRGYHTASFVTNLNAKAKGFGFDETFYNEIIESIKDPTYISPFSFKPLLIRRVLGTQTQLSQDFPLIFPREFVADWYIDAGSMNRFVQRWLSSAPDQPLFLHIHYLDPHEPYMEHPYSAVQFNLKSSITVEKLRRLYGDEIEYLDRQLGELKSILKNTRGVRNRVTVFTSDHGEEFLDHGGWGHGNHLFNETVRVPLILNFSDGRYAGTAVDYPAASIDIAPTILSAIDAAAPEKFEGQSLLDLLGRGQVQERSILMHLQAPTFESHALLRPPFKYIRRTGLQAGQWFFNLETDPEEQVNLFDELIDERELMQEDLELLLESFETTRFEGRKIQLTEEQKERLRALGYLK